MPRRNGVHTHTEQGLTDTFPFLLVLSGLLRNVLSLSLRMKIQNAEQDQGHRLAGEEFHSSFSAHSALLYGISVIRPVVSFWRCCSDSSWFENEKKSLTIDLALDRGFHLRMKFLTVCADKSFLKEAASLSGLEGEEEGRIQQWKGHRPTQNVSDVLILILT